jgi:hypothetical protein
MRGERHKTRVLPYALMLCMLTAAIGLALVLLPRPLHAQEQERCFEQTGHCIRGAMLDYWQQNGGLAVFGYPISDLRLETVEETWTGPVQWFERDRLEDHGIEGILAGRLGADTLELRGFDWWEPANRKSESKPGCRYFETTGQNLCEPFLGYWEQNGGLERFGYPLTGAYPEQIGDWQGLVQYFERRRMEYHTDLPGGDSAVLLGHLGRDVLTQGSATSVCPAPVAEELRGSFERVAFRSALGCPQQVAWNVPAAVQPFERGRMLWLDLGAAGRKVVALSTMPVLFQHTYDDTWSEGETFAADPPPNLLAPKRGFGKLWHAHSDLQTTLGWATGPEQGTQATVQPFEHGWLIRMHASDTVYALGPQRSNLTIITPPSFAPDAPAPFLGGELVVSTHSVDFYRLPGSLTASEVRAISSAVEASIASGSTMMKTNLAGRVALRFEPPQTGICAIRGLTLSNQRTIRMFYGPGSNLRNIEAILAHEFVHQLQHDYYGARDHLRSDIILLEGMAMWGSSPYYLDDSGQPQYHANARTAMQEDILLPLTTSLQADCRTSTRNFIYDQWGSFVEYLLLTYGRERFDAVYANSAGRPPGSASYEAVYGKSLAQLEAEWLAWLAAQE